MADVNARRAAARREPPVEAAPPAPWRIGPLEIAIILLALATALMHLDKALAMGLFGGSAPAAPAGMPGGGPPRGRPTGVPGGGLPLPLPLPVLFLLNFLGYLILIAARYLPIPPPRRYQRMIRWALIVYAATTLLGYYAVVGLAPVPLGAPDKAVEIALIVFLLIEDRFYSQEPAQAASG